MKVYAVSQSEKFDYIEYLGVMTLLRAYPSFTLIVRESADSEYLRIVNKVDGINIRGGGSIDQQSQEDMLVINPRSITLGEFSMDNLEETVMTDSSFLFEGDEFPGKDIKHVVIKKEPGIDEIYVSQSDSNYAKLIRRLLPERIWNPLNKSVWGVPGSVIPVRPMNKKFRFHVLGLVHLPTSEEYMSCAFTQKNVKLCKMLMDLGHEVYLYGAEGSTAPCTEFIQTHSLKDIRDSWGEGDNRFEIGYDWKHKQFKHDFNSKRMPATLKYYTNAVAEIVKRKQDDDFLLVTQGYYQKPVGDAVGLHMTLEPGIGYRGSYAPYRAFESNYIRYFTYGGDNPRGDINGSYYDRIIPNYYNLKDFAVTKEKGDYYLYMGRLIIRKGLGTAIKAATALGRKLIVAGQMDAETTEMMKNPIIEYIGYADSKKRMELMGRARAVFTPSIYLEPFCGVHVEAMLCGTPVLTTNFGAFTDYVIDGVNGYKCNTLQDFVDGARLAEKLDPMIIRKTAERFSLESVRLEYQRWFQDVYRVYESIKDPSKKAWHYLEM